MNLSTQIDILDEYLHDLGVIIHFTDRLDLSNMVILKPEWATSAFYKILDTKSVRDRSGILLHSELNKIWDIKIYPQDIYPKLLELMNKFELAYELPDKKSHLVAELLPSTEPEFEWDDTNALRFYYCYDFLPAGVMTRFIVRMHKDLEFRPDGKQLCWREGAVVNWEKTRAFVKVKPMECLIEIKISGDKKGQLLAIIRREFNHINSSIKKIKISEEIPCNCSKDCLTRFEYKELIKAENAGIKDVTCLKKSKIVPISLLLEGYEKKENRMKEMDMKEHGGTTNYNGPVGTVINSGRDTKTGDITSNPAPPPQPPEKKKSFQDIIANPATIAAFIITLVVIYLTLPINIAVQIIIIGILIFVFLVALNPKKG